MVAADYGKGRTQANAKYYIYEIDYRGIMGFDTLETLEATDRIPIEETTRYKQEVNIGEYIKPEDIIGAWEVTTNFSRWLPNEGYNKRRTQEIPSVSARRVKLIDREYHVSKESTVSLSEPD